jgi:hypothetical protein
MAASTLRSHLVIGALLVLSLAGNAWLARSLLPPSPARSGSDERTAPGSAASLSPEISAQPAVAMGSHATVWEQLARGTPKELRFRLEEAGFPRSLIKEIVSHVIFEELRPDSLVARAEKENWLYWQAPRPRSESDREQALEYLNRSHALMREAFGPLAWQYGREDSLRQRYGDLSLDKLERLAAIQNDYRDIRRDRKPTDPVSLSASADRLRLLAEQERADLVALLTPQELFEYDLRSSGTRHHLTNHLHHLGMSEVEYRTLFPIYHEAMSALRNETYDPATAREGQAAMDAALQPKIRAALGETRYADYLQAADPASEKLNRVAARFGLPLSTAAQVAAVRRDVSQRAEALRDDRSLAPEVRAAALATLHTEADIKITTALGSRAAEAYVSYDGRWLQELVPMAAK